MFEPQEQPVYQGQSIYSEEPKKTYCGFFALVGRPNVGKSTLLNALVNQKVSITSPKPQTTRCQILGVKTTDHKQVVWIDTPGMHIKEKKALNKYMNHSAQSALTDVNGIVFVVEALKWTDEDEKVWKIVNSKAVPLIIAVNKIDKIKEKNDLLPFLQMLQEKAPQARIIPLSALAKQQCDALAEMIDTMLPEDYFYFPKEMSSNINPKFHMAELIRERLMTYLQEEIPYSIAVQIEHYESKTHSEHIHALIWVEREAQKHIVIGKNGQQLKQIGINARLALEQFIGKKVTLKLWVKVKSNWSSHHALLEQMVEGSPDVSG